MECEVLHRTCDNCHKRKIVYPRLPGAYADILECAGNGRVWVYLCSECLQALRERRRCGWEFNMYMTTIQADALGLYAGRSWTPGLLERCFPSVIWHLPLSLRTFPPLSLRGTAVPKQSRSEAISLLTPARHTLNMLMR